MQRGQAAIKARDLPEAIKCFTQAVEHAPHDPQAQACLGQSYCWQGQVDTGLRLLRNAGQLLFREARRSGDITRLLAMTEQLQFWQDYEGALKLTQQAVSVNVSAVRAHQLLALSYSQLNRPAQALKAGEKAARLAPQSTMLQIFLATLEAGDKRYDAACDRLQSVLTHPLSPEEAFRARKELARVLDKLGAYAQVFPHLHAASQLAGQLPEIRAIDRTLVPQILAHSRNGFTAQLLSRWMHLPDRDEHPAITFIIGFMRSGTTLTQQVLAAHPSVFVADETNLLPELVAEVTRLRPQGASLPERLSSLSDDDVLALRTFYWQKARQRFGDALSGRHFVDKTTMNTIDLGMINCLFPDAKVIFVRRDPRDICLSCYMQTMVPTPSTVHLLEWQGSARFFADVMAFWETMKPRLSLQYRELCYEDAVSDFTSTFQHLFQFLQLPWDPAVTAFHTQAIGKFIASPSHNQVSQPLYASSVGRWRHYAQEFDSIHELLAPYIKDAEP